MKGELLRIIDEITDLLDECNWADRADWFRGKAMALRRLSSDSDEFRQLLTDLRQIIAGMGSFSDLPLYPGPASKLDLERARQRQWDLAKELGNTLDRMSVPPHDPHPSS